MIPLSCFFGANAYYGWTCLNTKASDAQLVLCWLTMLNRWYDEGKKWLGSIGKYMMNYDLSICLSFSLPPPWFPLSCCHHQEAKASSHYQRGPCQECPRVLAPWEQRNWKIIQGNGNAMENGNCRECTSSDYRAKFFKSFLHKLGGDCTCAYEKCIAYSCLFHLFFRTAWTAL